MKLLLLCSLFLYPRPASASGPEYFTGIKLGRPSGSGEQHAALQKMVELADAQNLKLTLFFSPQYAAYISSDPARAAELAKWGIAGHEVGALRVAPDKKDWDGYSDLPRGRLSKLRPGELPRLVPGREAFLEDLRRVSRGVRSVCTSGSAEPGFLRLSPGYEACGGGTGVNASVQVQPSRPGEKTVSAGSPLGKSGVAAASAAFKAMKTGLYGAVFTPAASDFGAYYAWLQFLRGQDEKGTRSRTVSEALRPGLLPEAAATERAGSAVSVAKPDPKVARAEAQQKDVPRLKPVPSFSERGRRIVFRRFTPNMSYKTGYCGDGFCDFIESLVKHSCPRDCLPRRKR